MGFLCYFAWGEVGWEEMSRRFGKLKRYRKEAEKWSELLKVVVGMMVMGFKNLKSDEAKDLWLKVANQNGRDGSGNDIEIISGWIEAFCFWVGNGKRIERAEKAVGEENCGQPLWRKNS